MSQVTISGNASGTGVFTIASPNSNNTRTLTLPDATATLVGDTATQTLTNKTLGSGTVQTVSLIQSGTTVASTSGTAIDFTGIPSWVKRITVMFSGVSTVGAAPRVQVQIGAGSITTTGYWSVADDGGGATSSTAGFIVNQYGVANIILSGQMVITTMGSNIWNAGFLGVAGSVSNTVQRAAGTVTLSGTLDRLRITTLNGTDTFDAGSINILYE